jgi:ATP-binding cassette subfamily B protein
MRILEALRKRHGRRTTIIIAHRLSSVAHADRILVLDHGQVVQAGKHAELIAQEGPYQRLWQIQNALEDEIAADVERVPVRPDFLTSRYTPSPALPLAKGEGAESLPFGKGEGAESLPLGKGEI